MDQPQQLTSGSATATLRHSYNLRPENKLTRQAVAQAAAATPSRTRKRKRTATSAKPGASQSKRKHEVAEGDDEVAPGAAPPKTKKPRVSAKTEKGKKGNPAGEAEQHSAEEGNDVEKKPTPQEARDERAEARAARRKIADDAREAVSEPRRSARPRSVATRAEGSAESARDHSEDNDEVHPHGENENTSPSTIAAAQATQQQTPKDKGKGREVPADEGGGLDKQDTMVTSTSSGFLLPPPSTRLPLSRTSFGLPSSSRVATFGLAQSGSSSTGTGFAQFAGLGPSPTFPLASSSGAGSASIFARSGGNAAATPASVVVFEAPIFGSGLPTGAGVRAGTSGNIGDTGEEHGASEPVPEAGMPEEVPPGLTPALRARIDAELAQRYGGSVSREIQVYRYRRVAEALQREVRRRERPQEAPRNPAEEEPEAQHQQSEIPRSE